MIAAPLLHAAKDIDFGQSKNQKAAFGFLLALFLWLSCHLGAAIAEPNFPALNNTRVVDQAGLLSPESETKLNEKLKALEDTTTDQMVVVTLKSLDGYDIDDYGYQLGRHWGIGQSGKRKAPNGETYKNNGVLLIIAPNERKVRIEVGYDLEPVITDAYAARLIQTLLVPKFRQGDFDGGITDTVDALTTQLLKDRNLAISEAAQVVEAKKPTQEIPLWLIIVIIIVSLLLMRAGIFPWFLFSGGGSWSGGGGGGGFSGGGGSFGGGGSSGSW